MHKILRKSVHKNDFQRPNIESIFDVIQTNLDANSTGETARSRSAISRYCNFNVLGGEDTGTYRFITGFYCLTDMPTAFQEEMNYILLGCKHNHCFVYDIIIFSRGSQQERLRFFK